MAVPVPKPASQRRRPPNAALLTLTAGCIAAAGLLVYSGSSGDVAAAPGIKLEIGKPFVQGIISMFEMKVSPCFPGPSVALAGSASTPPLPPP